MKFLGWICFIQLGIIATQNMDIGKIRQLYINAAGNKQEALQLDQLMVPVDTDSASPLLICYKGANEMIQAKYALSPIVKFKKFNKGKALITKAISRDTLNLEMRFIRYSIQSNLPAFLPFHNELDDDKRFLQKNTNDCKDPDLKNMIFNYLPGLFVNQPKELKN